MIKNVFAPNQPVDNGPPFNRSCSLERITYYVLDLTARWRDCAVQP